MRSPKLYYDQLLASSWTCKAQGSKTSIEPMENHIWFITKNLSSVTNK